MTKKTIVIKHRTLFKKSEDIFIDITARIMHEFERVIVSAVEIQYVVKSKSQELDIYCPDFKVFSVILSKIECITIENDDGMKELLKEYKIKECELQKIIAADPYLQNIHEPEQRTFEIIIEITIPENLDSENRKLAEQILNEFELKII